MHRIAAGLALFLLAGCSASSSGDTISREDAQVCAEALDTADAGFTAFGENIEIVRQALNQAFDGNLAAAQATLRRVDQPSPDRYKHLEAQCREAVAP